MAYPVNLGEILLLMGYKLDIDFEAQDLQDGNGPIISVWNSSDPQPTETDINNFYSAYLVAPDRLVEKKTEAKRIVDTTAEATRQRFITFGTGQSMTYLRKEDEAEKYKAAGYPTISGSEYPWIKAEMDATQLSGQEVADSILAARDAWLSKGTEIERERKVGKKNIDAAANEDGVNTARDTAIGLLKAI